VRARARRLGLARAPHAAGRARHRRLQRPGDRGPGNFGRDFGLFWLAMRTRTVTWGDPFAIMQTGVGKTGLESLREMFTKNLPPPPIAELMGFSLVQVDE